ncbi:hypothetical protein ACQEVS_10330 [Streptomyces sp. CA-181903]|uniref:hypothetical protein n=1 Tax=Streptomyces sp. CA-181903 TaxID=3240055 RepID=UPI003D928328
MATPPWWGELVSISTTLADADRAEIEYWQGTSAGSGAHYEGHAPPLTLRLSTLGRVFGEQSADFTREQRQQVLRLLERVQADDRADYGDAVCTGFFEALLNTWDNGFDLRLHWTEMGPRSRSYCRAWNDFTGVETPDWMS